MPSGRKKQKGKNKCSVCQELISTHVGPWGPGKCSRLVAAGQQTHISNTSGSCTTSQSWPSDGVHNTSLDSIPGQSTTNCPPGGVQVSTVNEPAVNLHGSSIGSPAVMHLPVQGMQVPHQQSGIVNQTNSYISTVDSASANVSSNTNNCNKAIDSQALEASINLIISNMARMQTQLNSVLDKQSASSSSNLPTQPNSVLDRQSASTSINNFLPHSTTSTVYHSTLNRPSNLLPNLGGPTPGLRSTIGITDYSSSFTIPGTPDRTIRQGLQGEYVCLDEFLQNFTVNNTEVQDIQSYVDSSGNVAYRNKRQKRRVNSFNTWLEAWHNYERLLLSFHGYHLYDVCTKYKLLILSLDRKYAWPALSILDMRHRLSLSGHSVQFDSIDPVLFNSVMDPTTVKTSATRCYRCKSFDHTVGECPFPTPASANPAPRSGARKAGTASQPEVCNNFNSLHCVLTSCKRLHICKSCKGDLPYDLCSKQGRCATNKTVPQS